VALFFKRWLTLNIGKGVYMKIVSWNCHCRFTPDRCPIIADFATLQSSILEGSPVPEGINEEEELIKAMKILKEARL
jgi:hypothetical protein